MSILKNKVRSFLKKLTSSFSEDEKVLIRRCIKFSASVFVTSLILFYLPEVRKVINNGVSGLAVLLLLCSDFIFSAPPFSTIIYLIMTPSFLFFPSDIIFFSFWGLLLNNLFFIGCIFIACSIKKYKRLIVILTLVISIPAYFNLNDGLSHNKFIVQNFYSSYTEYLCVQWLFLSFLLSLIISHFIRMKKEENIIILSNKFKTILSLLLICIFFTSITHNSYFIDIRNAEDLEFNKVITLPERTKVRNVKIEVEDLNLDELSEDLRKNINNYKMKVNGNSLFYRNKDNVTKKIFLFKKIKYQGGYSSSYIDDNKKLLITDNDIIAIVDISTNKPKVLYKYKLPDNYYSNCADYRNRFAYENNFLYLKITKKENKKNGLPIRYIIKINLDKKTFDEIKIDSEVNFLSNKYIFVYSINSPSYNKNPYYSIYLDIYKFENFEHVNSITSMFITDKLKYDFKPSRHLFDGDSYLDKGFVYRLAGIKNRTKIDLREVLMEGKVEND